MKLKYSLILLAAFAFATLYVACNNNSSNNPASNNNNTGATFTFKVGNSFVFKQWTLDTLHAAKIDSTLKIVHDKIVASLSTFQGMSNVYEAFDTTFADSTATTVQTIDTLYFATSGGIVYQYGFITQLFSILLGPLLPMPPKWDIITNAGSSNWLVDTTKANPSGFLPLLLTLNGSDLGNGSLATSSGTMQVDQVSGSGNIKIFADDTSKTPVFTFVISGETSVSYNPAIPAKGVVQPAASNIGTIAGYERDLVSFTTN